MRNRTDKKNVAAWKAIGRVELLIDDGTVLLPEAKLAMLSQLLAEARSEVMSPRRNGSKHPSLEGLAHALQRDFSIADAQILVSVAAVTGLACSERTAQRYITRAKTP